MLDFADIENMVILEFGYKNVKKAQLNGTYKDLLQSFSKRKNYNKFKSIFNDNEDLSKVSSLVKTLAQEEELYQIWRETKDIGKEYNEKNTMLDAEGRQTFSEERREFIKKYMQANGGVVPYSDLDFAQYIQKANEWQNNNVPEKSSAVSDFSKLSLEEILEEYQMLDAYLDEDDDLWDKKYAEFEEALKAVDGEKMDKIYSNYIGQNFDLQDYQSVYDMDVFLENIPFPDSQKKAEIISKINKFKENFKAVEPEEYAKSMWGRNEAVLERAGNQNLESAIDSPTPENDHLLTSESKEKEAEEQVELENKDAPVSVGSYMQAKREHWKGWCDSKSYVYEEVNATDEKIGFHFRYYKNEEAKKDGDFEADVHYPTKELAKVKSKSGKQLTLEFWKSFAEEANKNSQLINFSKIKNKDNKAKLLLACIVSGTEYSNVDAKKINFADAFKELSQEDKEKAMKKLDLDKDGIKIEDKKFTLQDIMIMELHASRHSGGDIDKVRPNSYEHIKNQVTEQVEDGKSRIKEIYMQDKNYKRITARLTAVAEFAEKKGIENLTVKEYQKVANAYEEQKAKENNNQKIKEKHSHPEVKTINAKDSTRI